MPHCYESWLGGDVVIPKIVMDGLKVPDAFPGKRIHSHKRISEQPGSLAIGAIVIVRRRCQRQECDSSFCINGRYGPHVCTTPAFRRFAFPCIAAELPRLGHGVEAPKQFARSGVESPYITVGPLGFRIRHNRPTDHDVFVNRGR